MDEFGAGFCDSIGPSIFLPINSLRNPSKLSCLSFVQVLVLRQEEQPVVVLQANILLFSARELNLGQVLVPFYHMVVAMEMTLEEYYLISVTVV